MELIKHKTLTAEDRVRLKKIDPSVFAANVSTNIADHLDRLSVLGSNWDGDLAPGIAEELAHVCRFAQGEAAPYDEAQDLVQFFLEIGYSAPFDEEGDRTVVVDPSDEIGLVLCGALDHFASLQG